MKFHTSVKYVLLIGIAVWPASAKCAYTVTGSRATSGLIILVDENEATVEYAVGLLAALRKANDEYRAEKGEKPEGPPAAVTGTVKEKLLKLRKQLLPREVALFRSFGGEPAFSDDEMEKWINSKLS